MPKRTQLTDAADRAFIQQAVEQLRSSSGWQRWLTTRRHFHTYRLGTSCCRRTGAAPVIVRDGSAARSGDSRRA